MQNSTLLRSQYERKNLINRLILSRKLFFLVFSIILCLSVSAQVIRSASGSNAAAIQSSVDAFRTDLGALNPNVGGSFGTGRREINWDGVPDAFAAPNNLPANFFNVNSPRGVVFSTPGTGFQVSANAGIAPIQFGNIDPNYPGFFKSFSAQRLFTSVGSNVTDVNFFIPGTNTPALVRGFGSVFSDVDLPNLTSIQYFDVNNVSLGTFFAPAISGNETFSFLGVSYPTAVISRVRITAGNQILAPGNLLEVVVMDDFIYGEPIPPACTPPTITLGTNPTVCSGSTSADLPYTATTGSPDQYSIDYDATAEAAGFVDVVNAALPATPIVLVVPGAAPANTYNANLTVRNSSTGCSSSGSAITILVNPTPNAVATPSSQTVCSEVPITTIVLSGAVSGTTYTWTRNNTVNVTGIVTPGSGNISGTLTNITNVPQTVTFTITPTANGCPGTPITATVLVNPTPNAMATPSSQTICNNIAITTIVLTGNVSGTTYSWTRNNTATVTGIAATGNGNISGTLNNTTNAPVTVTFTITPTANGCSGPTTTATITMAPTPTVDPVANQTVCNGTLTAPVNFTGPVAGTIYNWTNSTPSIGLAASGTGNIAAFTGVNPTTLPVTGTVTVTPSVVIPVDNVPEILYYKFDGSGTSVPNQASAPPSGTATATIVGGQTQGGSGICNGTLIGSGNSSTTNYVNTNWATNLTGTSWSLSFKTSNIQPSTTLFYIFGDNTANSFRCFTNGVAGSNNWMLRGPVGDIIVPGGATVAPHTTTFVYDNVAGQLRGYLDGVLVVTNAQAPPTIAGSGPFKVGAYGGNTGLPTGGLMDEFRLYSRALSLTEIQELANGCAGGSTTCTGPTSTFTITVNPTPTITCPANITVPSAVGACTAVVTYTPTVTGTPTPTLSYVLTGATTGTGTGTGSGTAFRVGVTTVTITATNICATVTCSFTITVTDSQLPVITTQPANRTVCTGSNAAFSVTAITAPSAGGPLSYQWQQWNGSSWNNITGATSSTYTVTNTTVAMNTNSFRVQVIGLCTTVTSTHATLYVNPLPTINLTTSIPPNLLPTQVLTITATTAPSSGSYVWFKNGVVIAGASGSTLANLTVSDIGTYRVVYTDPNGCIVTSSDVVITGQASDNLYVYPIPNNGQFIVRFYNASNEQITLRVLDTKGSEVYRRKVQTTIPYTTMNVDLATGRIIANGVYIVEVRRADGSLAGSRRIIVYK